jgi:hypothetical protein
MRVWVLSIGLLPLCGCIFLPGSDSDHDRGVPLSHAMEASASGSREPLQGSSGSHDSDSGTSISSEGGSGVLSGAGGDFAMVDYDNKQFFWQVPVDAAYVVPFNGDIIEITRFTITPVAFEDEHNYFAIYFGGDIVDLKRGSLPDEAVKNSWMLEAGLAYRRYLNGPHILFSPYVTGTIGWQGLHGSIAIQSSSATTPFAMTACRV